MKFFLLASLLYAIAHAFSSEIRSFVLAVDHRDVDRVIGMMTSMRNLVDPTINGNDALYMACEQRSAPLLKILLDDGRIDPSEEANRAFYDVFQNGYTDLVGLFLKDGRVNFSLPALVFHNDNLFESLSQDKIVNPLLIELDDIRNLSIWEVEYILYVLKQNHPDHYLANRDRFKLAALKVPTQRLQDDTILNFYYSLDGPKMLIEELQPHFEMRLNLLLAFPNLPSELIAAIANHA